MSAVGKAMRSWLVLVALALRADRRRTLVVLVLAPMAGVAATGYGLSLTWLVSSVLRRDPVAVAAATATLAGALVGAHLLGIATARVRMSLQQQISHRFDRELMTLCMGVPGLAHHESREHQNRLQLLRSNSGTIVSGFGALVENLRNTVRLVSILILLGSIDPRLLVLPLFALPAVYAAGLAQRVERRVGEEAAEPQRLRAWLFTLATGAAPAKEIRVYGLTDELAGRHDRLQRRLTTLELGGLLRTTALGTAGSLVFAAGLLGSIALVLHRTATGTASATDVVLLVTLAGQIDGTMASAAQLSRWLRQATWATGLYTWLVEYSRDARTPSGPVRPVPERPGADLVLDGVSFAYPGTTELVLRDVSLRLRPGTVLAVVGENGAGKSTLVKLLCRLYEPTSGRIALGEADLRSFDVAQWRSRLATGFQDFCRFEFPVRHTVGVGNLAAIDDEETVRAALRHADAERFVDALPHGLDTQLGRTFDDGTDLSTGQWQKLAMARAVARPVPLLLVLDEPTASLDPAAEHQLFEHYADAARRGDTITVLVSHRFSTVRMADLIVVLDGGRVTQLGSHDELVTEPGTYADLYELHSRGYRETVVSPAS